MEQRKLIQHGASSLTIALPITWLKERGLQKGNSLFVKPEGNKLIISTQESLKINKISTNITELDRTSAMFYIQSLYKFGYNEVELIFDRPMTKHHRKGQEVHFSSAIHKMINRCIGFEVVEQSECRMLIKHIGKEEGEDFKVVLRRAFLLLKEASNALYEGIRDFEMSKVETIEEMHDNVNKFVSHCLRLLNKYGYPDVKKTCFYYHIIASLDKIMDFYKYTARDILKYNKKFNKETINIWEQINKSLEDYYKLFYNFDFKIVDQLSQNRDYCKNLIKKAKNIPRQEFNYIVSIKQILEIVLDLTDCRMGLEY